MLQGGDKAAQVPLGRTAICFQGRFGLENGLENGVHNLNAPAVYLRV